MQFYNEVFIAFLSLVCYYIDRQKNKNTPAGVKRKEDKKMGAINYGSSNYVNLGLNLSLDIYQDFDAVQILAKDVENIIYNRHFQYFTVDISRVIMKASILT